MKDKYYYSDGSTSSEIDYSKQLHRVDGPAIEHSNGTKYWYLNGRCHRVDGPAIEYSNGTKFWYLNGRYHRVDGPAYEGSDGSKAWYLNGEHITKLTKDQLINYMKSNNYILAHLLTDPESMVREAALKYGDKL